MLTRRFCIMLKMIQCDKFMENGMVRPPIVFNRGLNTILGTNSGANSIGKSTVLMLLDFVFGGTDYIRKSIDIFANMGHHVINFTFEFEDGLYYFSRATDHALSVNVCNSQFQVTKVISNDAYTKFLSSKFNLDLPDLTFRNAISRFFRIHGRETLDSKLPLQNAAKEPMRLGIDGLLKLFNRHDELKKQKELQENAKIEESAFKSAQKYNYLQSISTKDDYKANEKRMGMLEKEIKDLIRTSDAGFTDIDTVLTANASEIRQELSIVHGEYIWLTDELNSITIAQEKRPIFERNYEALLEFFPNANVPKLVDYEQFHEKTRKLLKAQFKEKERALQKQLNLAAQRIAQLEMKLSELVSTPTVTHAVLNTHAEKLTELQLLRESNNNYDKKLALTQRRKELTVQLDHLVRKVISDTEATINAKMVELNDFIYNGMRTSPNLKIRDSDHYTFFTPDDLGTGSLYKGLIVFDLAILQMTPLPVLVHDSVLLKQIEDDAVEEILRLYIETEKQIFIVLDKQDSFTEKAQKILRETAVLNLYPNGGELFGRSWNHK